MTLAESYAKTPQLLKIIDAYLLFVMSSGIIVFLYMVLVGNFPYNAFLSGFASTVGTFVLAANLRMQLNPQNKIFQTQERYLFKLIIELLLNTCLLV
jgi:oligosaccharyltransferase complex subunit epsilon